MRDKASSAEGFAVLSSDNDDLCGAEGGLAQGKRAIWGESTTVHVALIHPPFITCVGLCVRRWQIIGLFRLFHS